MNNETINISEEISEALKDMCDSGYREAEEKYLKELQSLKQSLRRAEKEVLRRGDNFNNLKQSYLELVEGLGNSIELLKDILDITGGGEESEVTDESKFWYGDIEELIISFGGDRTIKNFRTTLQNHAELIKKLEGEK